MRTRDFVSRVAQSVSGVSRVDVVAKTNEALDIIYGVATSTMRLKDSSTGKDPILVTTAGVFSYDLDAIKIGGTEESPVEVPVETVARVYLNADEPTEYREDPVVKIYNNANATGSARIVFNEDPKAAEYYLECYGKHDRLVSESYPTDIPLPNKFVIRFLFPLVVGMYEDIAHGKSVRLEEFMGRELPKLRGEMNASPDTVVRYVSERYY